MVDILIKNGTVFDGTGASSIQADVAIQNGRIVAIEASLPDSAQITIDATEKYVAPGFIDVHTHSDFSLLVQPEADSKIRQGITTEIVGNCGLSPAPAYGQQVEELQTEFADLDMQVTWHSFGEYLEKLAQLKPTVNVIALVGHGGVRSSVMGVEDRAPTPGELSEMKKLVQVAMEEGAWGMSTGLIYPPGVYAKTDEIVELAKAVRQAGGLYTSHIRGEASTVLSAVAEAIAIGRQANIAVQISHLKLSGYHNWDKLDDLLKLIDDAIASGLPVHCDQYPYAASETFLLAVFPEWIYEGGAKAATQRLADPAVRYTLHDMLENQPMAFWDYAGTKDWSGILLTNHPPNREYIGKTVADVAAELGQDPFDTCVDLLIESECTSSAVLFDQYEPNVQTIMQHPRVMIGSDGNSLCTHGVLSRRSTHPRAYGTFPRVLGHYTREQRLLDWPQAIYKMTGLPAQAFGIPDRGLLQTKAWADIVVFDPATVSDKATFAEPHQYAAGIEHVILNGRHVVKHEKHTGVMAGVVLSP
jgi:N-acyl-D-amino-acid deacylase